MTWRALQILSASGLALFGAVCLARWIRDVKSRPEPVERVRAGWRPRRLLERR